jgi:hypothetical protein
MKTFLAYLKPFSSNLTPVQPASVARPSAQPRFDRLDIYGPIHKALRLCMMETLAKVGRADVHNAQELQGALADVDSLLALLRSHIDKETNYVHPALEAAQTGASKRIADEHDAHAQTIEALADEVAELRSASSLQRGRLMQRLYNHLALAVAENFEHMHIEETVHNNALWNAYSDDQLMAIENNIKASIAPQDMMPMMRWFARSGTPQFIITLMSDMQAHAPKEAFEAVLDLVRQQLSESRWSNVAQALDVPQVPGLVDFRSP